MNFKRFTSKITRLLLSLLTAAGIIGCSKKLSTEEIETLYAQKLPPIENKLNVYHLGHSLVGRNMPYMVRQLAGEGHQFKSQLGWGSTLQSHWEPKIPISGFESENDHKDYRDVMEAIDSQEYDAFVMTEMVELEAAIKYFESAKYVAKFAEKVSVDSPKTKIYLYESWHEVTDPKGWINRLDEDLSQYWEDEILLKALAKLNGETSIYMIPVGQVFSAFFKEVKRLGGVEGITQPEDIFGRNEDGSLDVIHINDIGNYFVALVHYAVLYRKSPEGLPYQLKRVDGNDALAPSAEAAALMQKITWQVVSQFQKSGI